MIVIFSIPYDATREQKNIFKGAINKKWIWHNFQNVKLKA